MKNVSLVRMTIAFFKEVNMVRINGYPGYEKQTREYICDLCGRRCDPEGTRSERLYRFEGDELCFECLLDAMELETVE